MPNRIIRESLLTSPNFNKLSRAAENHFFRLLLLTDDWGCLEITPDVIRGRAYAKKSGVSLNMIMKLHHELEDNGIIQMWADQEERLYAEFVTFENYNSELRKHSPKTPCPPWRLTEYGFDSRLPDETLQAFHRIAVAVEALSSEGKTPSYRQIIAEAGCSHSTLAKYYKYKEKQNRYTPLQPATDATPYTPTPTPTPNIYSPAGNGEYHQKAKEVIDYLNEKAGKDFKYSKTSLEHVSARLKEGFTVEQCKQVIDTKIVDDYFLDHPKYLNPQTLFRPSNFEKYLNEKPKKKLEVVGPSYKELK